MTEKMKADTDFRTDKPEGCKLVAHDTGDGWCLCVEDASGEVVAYLEWPRVWPEVLAAKDLRAIGFMVA